MFAIPGWALPRVSAGHQWFQLPLGDDRRPGELDCLFDQCDYRRWNPLHRPGRCGFQVALLPRSARAPADSGRIVVIGHFLVAQAHTNGVVTCVSSSEAPSSVAEAFAQQFEEKLIDYRSVFRKDAV